MGDISVSVSRLLLPNCGGITEANQCSSFLGKNSFVDFNA